MSKPESSAASVFCEAYLEALLWSSEPYDGEWDGAQASPELRQRARIECYAFLYRAEGWIKHEPTGPGFARAGHDFALTRNRHGAGFWDGDWPVYGELLTRIAQSFGELELYLGDDGLIYC